MGISNILLLAGGLGLFLYGIRIMGEGLELAAGSKLKHLLEVITGNRLLAVLVGFIVTAVIQSSSATTVMVVGFVNASLMTLTQAVGVIMGANIGTTVTSVLIAMNFSAIAPVATFIGVIMITFSKKKMVKHIGQVIAGFGILFMGMSTMSGAMEPLRDFQPFQDFIIKASNPIAGVLIGVVMTAIIQSSSASVGILQALAMQGLVPINFAVFVLYGQNIGTVVTTLISSIGTKTNSKRAALIHLLFNIIGAVLFVLISIFTPYTSWLERISDNTVVQISAAHIIFNVVTTIVMLPFANLLVKLSCILIPEHEKETNDLSLRYLDQRILNTPPFAVVQVGKEVARMAQLAHENFRAAAKALIYRKEAAVAGVLETEETINFLNHEITGYLIKINALDLQDPDSKYIGQLFHVVNDIERVGDHATNLAEAAQRSMEENLKVSKKAQDELLELFENVDKLLERSIAALNRQTLEPGEGEALYELEEHIDELTQTFQNRHIARLNRLECTPAAGMLFINTITDFERVGDHSINIAFSVTKKEDAAGIPVGEV